MISLPQELQLKVLEYCSFDDISSLKGIVPDTFIKNIIRKHLIKCFDAYYKTVNVPLPEFVRENSLAELFYNLEESDPEWTDPLDNAWTHPIKLTFPEHVIDFLMQNLFLLSMINPKKHDLWYECHMVAFDNFMDDQENLVDALKEAQYYFPFLFIPDKICIGIHCDKYKFALWDYIDDEGNHTYYGDTVEGLLNDNIKYYTSWIDHEEDIEYYKKLQSFTDKIHT